MVMMIMRAMDTNQMNRFMWGPTWRNFVDSAEASVFHMMAWLLTPRQIPNEEMGKRRRNGHFLSPGSMLSSEAYTESLSD